MKYGSLCSGVEAASLAWEPLGWQPAWFAEIEPFPAAVLAHHWPDVPNHGDITKFEEWEDGTIDILVGGTPCQSFSIAGKRGGLNDSRGKLALAYLGIADRFRPQWLVWENVPGVLSSNGGRDFGAFLGGLAELGYGVAYRILDAQYFGVPQRRRRVFVVANSRSWRRAAAVLFERAGVQRDTATGSAARENVTARTERSFGICRFRGFGDYIEDGKASTLRARDGKDATDLIVVNGRQDPVVSRGITGALDIQSQTNVVCVNGNIINKSERSGNEGLGVIQDGTSYTLTATNKHAISDGVIVRRLTPLECERLQGMPDNHTRIPWRGRAAEECPDGHRYKAIGNSMAVPVMKWIGERIEMAGVK